MKSASVKSVVFITGTFLGSNCWDEWILYFESKGYTCIAPAWPGKDTSPEDLRNRHPDPIVAAIRLDTLIHFYTTVVNALPYKSILIGHSVGGLIVQLLLQRGIGSSGVAIHSYPPTHSWTLKLLTLKRWWQYLGLFTSTQKTYMLWFRKWTYAIANEMSCKMQKEFYYKYLTPESKVLVRDTFTRPVKINFNKERPPLLFTSGGHDELIPAQLNYSNYKCYKTGKSVTDYIHFKYHNHLIFDPPASKEEADFILMWLQRIT